jgi:hypothetical protein
MKLIVSEPEGLMVQVYGLKFGVAATYSVYVLVGPSPTVLELPTQNATLVTFTGSLPVLASVNQPEPFVCACPHCKNDTVGLLGDHAEAGTEAFVIITAPACSNEVVVEVSTSVETSVTVAVEVMFLIEVVVTVCLLPAPVK